jgi:hypothetical protein
MLGELESAILKLEQIKVQEESRISNDSEEAETLNPETQIEEPVPIRETLPEISDETEQDESSNVYRPLIRILTIQEEEIWMNTNKIDGIQSQEQDIPEIELEPETKADLRSEAQNGVTILQTQLEKERNKLVRRQTLAAQCLDKARKLESAVPHEPVDLGKTYNLDRSFLPRVGLTTEPNPSPTEFHFGASWSAELCNSCLDYIFWNSLNHRANQHRWRSLGAHDSLRVRD